MVVQHPVSFESGKSSGQMKATLEAVKSLKVRTIIIYPNADAGGRKMIDVIKKAENPPFITAYKSIPHGDYLGLMKVASVLAGNSSSAIIEAPSFCLPAVNIGTRQSGRERSGNVINTAPEKAAVKKALAKALYDRKFRKNVSKVRNIYGDGRAGKRIVKILSSLRLDGDLIRKQITY